MAAPSFLRRGRNTRRYIKPCMSTLNASSGVASCQVHSESLTNLQDSILIQLERGEMVIVSKKNKPACEYVQQLSDAKYATICDGRDDYFIQRRDKSCRKKNGNNKGKKGGASNR